MRDEKQTGWLDWLDLRRVPDLRRARWFGRLLGLVLLVLALGLVVLYLSAFVAAFLVVGDIIRGTAEPGAGLRAGALVTLVLGAPFVIWRAWVAQRQADVAQEGLITDRINKAVEGLGAEKTTSRVWRNVSYRLDGQTHTAFEGREEGFTPPEGATEIERGKWEVANRTQPNLEVRIGAIHALERIAQDSDRDHVQIMEILCAYIRENAPAREAPPWPELEMKPGEDKGPLEADWDERLEAFKKAQEKAMEGLAPRTDIQVALTVIGRRSAHQRRLEARWGAGGAAAEFAFDLPCPDPDGYLSKKGYDPKKLKAYLAELRGWEMKLLFYPGYRLDLQKANLRGADISRLNFNGARFDGCEMQGVKAFRTSLQGASLQEARLQGAELRHAQMQGANLWQARLQTAILFQARMQRATLSGAQMQGANLTAAWMQSAILLDARMQGADLRAADLRGADLAHARIQGANLGDADLQLAMLGQARMHGAALSGAQMQGACVRDVDEGTVEALAAHLGEMFGDGSVMLPKGVERPRQWPPRVLTAEEFEEEWRRWLADPEKYEPPGADDH